MQHWYERGFQLCLTSSPNSFAEWNYSHDEKLHQFFVDVAVDVYDTMSQLTQKCKIVCVEEGTVEREDLQEIVECRERKKWNSAERLLSTQMLISIAAFLAGTISLDFYSIYGMITIFTTQMQHLVLAKKRRANGRFHFKLSMKNREISSGLFYYYLPLSATHPQHGHYTFRDIFQLLSLFSSFSLKSIYQTTHITCSNRCCSYPLSSLVIRVCVPAPAHTHPC